MITDAPMGLVSAAEAPAPSQRAERRGAHFVAMTTAHRMGLTLAMMFALSVTLFIVSVLELPQLAFGLLTTAVAGSVGASLRIGRWRLRNNIAMLNEPGRRGEAIAALEGLADGPWRVQPVGVDARGHVALQRLEEGDLGGALKQARAVRLRSLQRERRRTPDAGFFGEVVSSVLGHLFPEAGLEVTPSSSFRVDEDGGLGSITGQFETMLGALRLLETVERGAPGPVMRAWNELGVANLRREAPALAVLVWASAARIVPALEAGLPEAIRHLDRRRRKLVRRRWPHLRGYTDATYRLPARTNTTHGEPLLHSAPRELAQLPSACSSSRWLPIAPRWTRGLGWLLMVQAVASILWLGEPLFVLAALAFTPMLAGSFHHRSRRVAPLRAAGIDAPVRLRELRRMRTRTGSRRSDIGRLHPFERGELMLIIGLHRAERALAEGDPDGARNHVMWWLVGADLPTIHRLDSSAIGASAIRVAALLEMDEVALRLADAFEPSTEWFDTRRRSGHGDAPRALALARSLMHAIRGRWYAAAQALGEAAEHPEIVLDRFERDLYGSLVYRIALRGHPVPPKLGRLATPMPARWLTCVWPAEEPRLALAAGARIGHE